MKSDKQPNLLKLITPGAAAAGCALRAAHYGFGTDGRNLLVPGHWSVWVLWFVTLAFAAALLILSSTISSRGTDTCRPSPAAAAGCFLLGAALLISLFRSFGDFPMTADLLIWVLGLCAAMGMFAVGISRFSGKKPYFLMHAVLCLYIALRTVAMYRRWSADPCLQDYGFYITAHATLMLASYHHAAFDAGMGNHRLLWVCSLGAVFFSCAALSRCDEKLLMAAFALWAFTNLTVLPVRKRRVRPTVQEEV